MSENKLEDINKINEQLILENDEIKGKLKTLKNEYNNQLIFQDLSDFEDWFERAKMMI